MRKDRVCTFSRRTIFPALLSYLWGASVILATDTTLFERGNDLLLDQKYSEAHTSLETFVKDNPDHRLIPATLWTMANIHFVIDKDSESAAKLFQKIVVEHPDTDWEFYGYDRLGSVFEEQEDWEEAVKVYRTATQKMSASDVDAEIQGMNSPM